jgi:hypothetical protein
MPISRIKTDGINDDAITSAKIGVDVIVADDLAANSVTVSEITNGAVTSAKLDTNIAIAGNLLVGSSSAVGNANANDLELTNSGGSGVVGMTFNVNSGSANTGNIYWRSNAANNNIQIVGDPITNYLAFATSGAEKLRIDSSGKVGIGTDSPTGKLQINGSDGALFAMRTTGDTSNQVMGTQYLNNSGVVTAQTFATGDSSSSSVFRIKAIGAIDLIGGDIGVTGALPDLRVTADGKVGIGTSDPSTPRRMDVVGSASDTYLSTNSITDNVVARIRNGSDSNTAQRYGGISLESGNAQFALQTVQTGTYGGALTIKTRTGASSYAERMRIDANGFFAVGPNLTTDATNVGDEDQFCIRDSNRIFSAISGTFNIFSRRGSTGEIIQFRYNSTAVGEIRTDGSSTSYVTSSDHRLKENVTADWDATTRLKQLNPVRFNFIADADTTVDGFLAHEVQSVVPEAISGTHNEVDDDGNPVYQGIDQSKLVPLLVKTIQELEARITALESN